MHAICLKIITSNKEDILFIQYNRRTEEENHKEASTPKTCFTLYVLLKLVINLKNCKFDDTSNQFEQAPQ